MQMIYFLVDDFGLVAFFVSSLEVLASVFGNLLARVPDSETFTVGLG